MALILNSYCPFPGKSYCSTDCMLLLKHVDADTVQREREETNNQGIACAIAVLASHIASENHRGGNWLAKVASWEGDAR